MMHKCPVCKTVINTDNQDYCLICAWEFEYFFDDLSTEEHNKYIDKKKIYQLIYDEYSSNKKFEKFEKLKLDFTQSQHKIQILEKENSVLKNEILELKEKKRVSEYIEKNKEDVTLVEKDEVKVEEKKKKFSVENKKLHINKDIVILNNLMYNIKLHKFFGKESWNYAMKSIKQVEFNNYTDWRLPTKEELTNLFLEEEVLNVFFNNVNNENAFWTIEERNEDNAWEVQLKNQMINWGLKTNKNFVIYVRDIKEEEE